jgi:cell division protein FtsI (penicillin-binding protein 3)
VALTTQNQVALTTKKNFMIPEVETKPHHLPSPLETVFTPVEVMPVETPSQPWRFTAVGGVLVVLMGFLWLEFTGLSLGLPYVPKDTKDVARGRVLLRDEKGSMTLSESTGKTVNLNRSYPQGRLASGVLGFVGKDNNGLEGIEKFENDWLASGRDLILTLDPVLQASAEATLENAMLSTDAESGTVIVMEAKTNRLLAVANAPSFDASNWRNERPGLWKNRAFRDTFDPGSTIKALVASMLVNEGKAMPETPINAPMQRQYRNDRPIRDAIRHPEDLTLQEVLRYSSNVGISFFADKSLSPEKLHDYLVKFGFGAKTWKNDPSLERNELSDWNGWSSREFATHSFGQGFTSTALQLATSFSVLVNDGKFVTPKLFEGQDIPVPRRVISESAARITRQMLEYTVSEGVPRARVPNYCVGGKTGTSETWYNGKKSASRYHALFAGFFPVDNPKVTIVVQLYAPKKDVHGSLGAAPVFRQIVLETAARYGIAPVPCVKK